MKRWLKWLILPLALALAAEALLLCFAGAFGGSTGEMGLKRPSAIWLMWHWPGVMLGFRYFRNDSFAVVLFITGILQFFVIFWLMIALITWIRRMVQPAPSEFRPPAYQSMQDCHAFRKTALRYWELRRVIYNVALAPAAVLGYAFADTFNYLGDPHVAHFGFVAFWLVISAFGANICYSFAYVLEFLFGCNAPASRWVRFGRSGAFVAGVLFAMGLAVIGGQSIAGLEYEDFTHVG